MRKLSLPSSKVATLSAMSSDTDGWHYASPNTVPGALQRGLGRGAYQVASTPDAPDLVITCMRRDYRWGLAGR